METATSRLLFFTCLDAVSASTPRTAAWLDGLSAKEGGSRGLCPT